VLDAHRARIEEQMADLQANLDEIKVHQREARALLAKTEISSPKTTTTTKTTKTTKTAKAPKPPAPTSHAH
jgi:hypothetical protein